MALKPLKFHPGYFDAGVFPFEVWSYGGMLGKLWTAKSGRTSSVLGRAQRVTRLHRVDGNQVARSLWKNEGWDDHTLTHDDIEVLGGMVTCC